MSSFSFHRSDFGGDLPLSDQLKFQQTSGSVLRDRFIVDCDLHSFTQQSLLKTIQDHFDHLPIHLLCE